MNRAAVLTLLNEHREQVLKRFGAKHLALFGSAARNELREDSDIDVLVEPDEAKARMPEVDRAGSARFRDVVAHRYFDDRHVKAIARRSYVSPPGRR